MTISSSTGGNVTDPGEGEFSYEYGSVVSLIAESDDFYHFSGWTGTGVGQVTDPNAASTTVTVDADYTLQANFLGNPIEPVMENSLDSDPGWSATGQWGYGVPTGSGGTEYGYPDPTSGCTGSNVYGVNLNGDYDTAIGGSYELIAGPFDLTGYYETSLEFCSWLNTDYPDYVIHSLEISLNGSDWTTLWEHTEIVEIVNNTWSVEAYDISTQADNNSTVYIKWSYEIGNERAYPYSGWNIDDIKVMGKAK